MATKSCVNIFIKNHKSTNPGANKVVEKNAKFGFFNMQNRTFVKKEIASEIFFYIF